MGRVADGGDEGWRAGGEDIAEVVSVRVDGTKETIVGGVEDDAAGARWFPVLLDERTRLD